MQIEGIKGREILDSRGNPTVEAELWLSNGARVLAAVPSGKSTGTHEAHELRDCDDDRYDGMGVQKAVENINTVISDALSDMDPTEQKAIDDKLIELDGTENKSKLGANAILAASTAVCKAGAITADVPLYKYIAELAGFNERLKMPTAMFNVINGGAHADNNLQIQEFMIVPSAPATFRDRVRAAAEQFHSLKDYLQNNGLSTSVGDEGGYAPNLHGDDDAVEELRETGDSKLAFDFAGHTPTDISFSWLANADDVVSIEDPVGEDDWQSWQQITDDFGERLMIVGDDLLVTNIKRLEKAIKEKACNAVLIKPNQIGTISETLDVIRLAKKNGFKVVVSHRSGETEDTFIADLAVGVSANFIKTGAPSRGERVAKYNRLMRIEEELLLNKHQNPNIKA